MPGIDLAITALPSATLLDGTEDLPIVQSGQTKHCQTQDIADLAIGKRFGLEDITTPNLRTVNMGNFNLVLQNSNKLLLKDNSANTTVELSNDEEGFLGIVSVYTVGSSIASKLLPANLHLVDAAGLSGEILLGTALTLSRQIIFPNANGTIALSVNGVLAGVAGDISLGTAQYADNAAAITGGLAAGTIYRTGDLLKIVH